MSYQQKFVDNFFIRVHKNRAFFNQQKTTKKRGKIQHIFKKFDLILAIFSFFNE